MSITHLGTTTYWYPGVDVVTWDRVPLIRTYLSLTGAEQTWLVSSSVSYIVALLYTLGSEFKHHGQQLSLVYRKEIDRNA